MAACPSACPVGLSFGPVKPRCCPESCRRAAKNSGEHPHRLFSASPFISSGLNQMAGHRPRTGRIDEGVGHRLLAICHVAAKKVLAHDVRSRDPRRLAAAPSRRRPRANSAGPPISRKDGVGLSAERGQIRAPTVGRSSTKQDQHGRRNAAIGCRVTGRLQYWSNCRSAGRCTHGH